jgi:hypothetical protein
VPEPWKPRLKEEARIQKEIVQYLKIRDWVVKETHGNMYQWGLPDVYAAHRKYKTRWIEIKQPTGYRLTPAQLDTFYQFTSVGVGIWILTAATEHEYLKLWQPPNWLMFTEGWNK